MKTHANMRLSGKIELGWNGQHGWWIYVLHFFMLMPVTWKKQRLEFVNYKTGIQLSLNLKILQIMLYTSINLCLVRVCLLLELMIFVLSFVIWFQVRIESSMLVSIPSMEMEEIRSSCCVVYRPFKCSWSWSLYQCSWSWSLYHK